MASACALNWIPDNLYNIAISRIVSSFNFYRQDISTLPGNVLFDIYYKLYSKSRLCLLCNELSNIHTFAKVLKVSDKRILLHHCFQALMDHEGSLSTTLADTFISQCRKVQKGGLNQHITFGSSLGGFLSDAGWYYEAEKVFAACLQLCQNNKSVEKKHAYLELDFTVRLLHVRNSNCQFSEAERSLRHAESLIPQLERVDLINIAGLETEKSALFFARSEYDFAYYSSIKALKNLHPSHSPRVIVDVLRQAAKACVVKRAFQQAESLIKYAVEYAKEVFGPKHHKYADALLDYGFCLLNIDSNAQAVEVYQSALDIRSSVFGGRNLHVAIAHEDLAYSTYVQEYSTGRFNNAQGHAERAIEIINCILPPDHLLLASAKRVKALILEEIAIDSHNKSEEQRLLAEAQDLHIQSLNLSIRAFGENNVQTAKHYGNLGRLYQSMHRYEEAEEMHLKAIDIKERLLGQEDYEVALSVGHLASLYNYDMAKYVQAESLYLRSIEIGTKLFGPAYSGLEYEYRGLLRLYHSVNEHEKAVKYGQILNDWNHLREDLMAKASEKSDTPNQDSDVIRDIHHVVQNVVLHGPHVAHQKPKTVVQPESK